MTEKQYPDLPQKYLDALLDHIYEHGTTSEGVLKRVESMLHSYADATCAMRAAETERQYICPTKTVADLVNNLLLLDQSLPIYGAQYIEHEGRRRAIAVGPTVSRERVKGGRWIGEGEDLNSAVIWTRAEQPAVAPAAPAAVAGPSESVKFMDQSTADPVEKARRYLKAMGDQRTNSAYFYDDGYPRLESASDALATLAVLEQLAAAPTTQPTLQPVAYRHLHEDGWEYYDAPTGSDCPDCEPLYTVAPSQDGKDAAHTALVKVLNAIQRYMPPNGVTAHDTLTEIISVVDPWPLAKPWRTP